MRTQCSFILLLASIVLFAGCRQIDYTTPARYQKGLVICLGGAGGVSTEVTRLRKGLYTGGVEYALEHFYWSHGDILKDQTDIQENRRMAGQLARRIEAYCSDYPSRSVYLIGKSAGTGLVVWALEDLRPGYHIDAAILIASSLYCAYDLTDALDSTNRLYSFHSSADSVLRFAATLTGTVDRRHDRSGGLDGFVLPPQPHPYTQSLYESRLTQRRWTFTDIFDGHMGGHFGATNPAFVRKRIAPLLIPASSRLP